MAKRPPEILEPCDTFEPPDIWLGMDYYMMGEGERCDTHCTPCDLDAVRPGVGDRGKRWLRPDPSRPSRDASGNFHVLRSAEPWLYPAVANFRRGSCYNNAGEECDGKVCHCDPQHEVDWAASLPPGHEGPPCMDGTNMGDPRTGYFADMTFATGNHFGNPDLWLDCRTERPPQLFALPARIQRGPNNQMGTARSGFCTSNLLVWCIGKRHKNECTATGNPNYPYGNEYFNQSANRDFDWHIMYVTRLRPVLVNSELRHPQKVDPANAILWAKNKALEYASQWPNPFAFDQMRHVNFDAPNNSLGHWRRGWSVEHVAQAPVYVTLPNCRLRFSGLPVRVELVVLSGSIEFDLVLHRVVHAHTHNTSTAHLYPSARFRMHLELGVRAEFTGESEIVLYDGTPVQLSLDNPSGGLTHETRRYPTLLPKGNDYLDFVDNEGRAFTPPTKVDWLGSLQKLSSGDGVWPDLFEQDGEPTTGNIVNYCHEIAQLLNQHHKLTVVGAPDVHTEETNKIQHYGGEVVVHLTTA